MEPNQSPRWIPRKKVRERYGTSDSSLSRWVDRGVFPAPETIGVNSQRWDADVLNEYDRDPAAWKAVHSRSAA